MHVGDLEYIFLATLIEQRQTSGQLQTTEVRSAEMHDRVFHHVSPGQEHTFEFRNRFQAVQE